jgi:hypothetical protein
MSLFVRGVVCPLSRIALASPWCPPRRAADLMKWRRVDLPAGPSVALKWGESLYASRHTLSSRRDDCELRVAGATRTRNAVQRSSRPVLGTHGYNCPRNRKTSPSLAARPTVPELETARRVGPKRVATSRSTIDTAPTAASILKAPRRGARRSSSPCKHACAALPQRARQPHAPRILGRSGRHASRNCSRTAPAWTTRSRATGARRPGGPRTTGAS